MPIRKLRDTFLPRRRLGIRPDADAGVPACGDDTIAGIPPREPMRVTRAEDPLESALDEALEETFPASDPIAVHPASRRRAGR